jgi:hypothetical protein
MGITASLKAVISNAVDWRGRNVRDIRTLVLNNLGNKCFEELFIIFTVLVTAPSPIIDPL